ncbi:MAG: hypothetical protein WAM14_20165 [Candidatus Nitrosopolaris sp.]
MSRTLPSPPVVETQNITVLGSGFLDSQGHIITFIIAFIIRETYIRRLVVLFEERNLNSTSA